MKNRRRIGSIFSLLLLFLSWAPSLQAQEAEVVRAYFNPSQLQEGQIGTYVVEIAGAQVRGQFTLPQVPGLEFTPFQNHVSLQVSNNHRSVRDIHTFRVRAQQVGSYTMPEYVISAGKETLRAPTALLEVVAHGESSEQEPQAPFQLVLDLPRDYSYVGEAFTLKVHFYSRGDVQGSILEPFYPVIVGEAFIGGNKPRNVERSHANFEGAWYNKLTWDFVITPFKEGDYPLSFELGLAIQRPSENRLWSFDTQKGLISTEKAFLGVCSLPEEGQPESFTGAIGSFVAEKLPLDRTDLQVGEPVTLGIVITGEGNFDRIQAPELQDTQTWKTYTPKTDFRSNDPLGQQGAKTFEYIVIPQEAGLQHLPSLKFSFFDPEKEAYQSFIAQWPELNIKEVADTSTSVNKTTLEEVKQSTVIETGLLPIKPNLGQWVQYYQPLFFFPKFWLIQGILLAILMGVGYPLRRRKRLICDEAYAHYRNSENRVKQLWSKVRTAVAANNTVAFAESAQEILLAVFIRSRGIQAYALTWPEVEAILIEKKAPQILKQETKSFFELSETVRFAGATSEKLDLAESLTQLERIVTQLKQIL